MTVGIGRREEEVKRSMAIWERESGEEEEEKRKKTLQIWRIML